MEDGSNYNRETDVKEIIVNIFDTETTGLAVPNCNDTEKQPHIIEIYVGKYLQKRNGKIELIGEYDTLIRPPEPVSKTITRITGIDNDMLECAKPFRDKYLELAEFFKGVDRMVAHNMTFDRNMLMFELGRIGKVLNFPWPIQHVCTVEKSMKIEQRRMSLKNLHIELVGYEFEAAHRAKNDVEALARVYQQMITKGYIL